MNWEGLAAVATKDSSLWLHFKDQAPHPGEGEPGERSLERAVACSGLRPLSQHFMNPQRQGSQSPQSYTRNLQNLRCRRQPIRLLLTEGPSLSLPACSVGQFPNMPPKAVNWGQTKMAFFYLSIPIKEILQKNLSEFTPEMSWTLNAEKQ